MNIALIAHDNKKELMAQFCTAYCGILAQHTLCATATTGQIISDATGLTIHRFLSFSHGGGQQIAARIAYNEIDLVLCFDDPATRPPTRTSPTSIACATRTTSPMPAIWPRRRCWFWVWPVAIWIGATSSIPKPSPLPLDISLHIPYNRLRSNRYDGA